MLLGVVCIPKYLHVFKQADVTGTAEVCETLQLCKGEGNSCFCIPPLRVTQLLSGLKYTFHSPLEKEEKEIALHLYLMFYREIMITQQQYIRFMIKQFCSSLWVFFKLNFYLFIFYVLDWDFKIFIIILLCFFLENNCIMFHDICIIAASLERILSLPGCQEPSCLAELLSQQRIF